MPRMLRMTRSNQFDNLNRLTNLVWTVGSTVVASYAQQFNSANQKTRVTLMDGSYWLYQYDPLGQVISSKKYWADGTAVAGQQGTFDFDDIGNRRSAASGGDQFGLNLRSAYYTNNTLNQITGRSVPGYVDVLGTATNTATVTVNNQATYRRNDYFRAELTATNASASLWFGVTNLAVLNNGTNADIVASTTGFVFVAQSPETFSYDLDGNLTNSGRWTISWDAENRATSLTRISSAPSGSKAKLDCTYDYRWRRTQKIVSSWNGSAYVAQSTNKFVYDGWNLVAILNATNGLVQSFTWGSDASGSLQGAGGVGGLISMTVHTGTNAGTYFYCFDGNHNVTALVNATNGATAAQYEFDAFGNPLRATGALAFVNPFTFSTKFCDWETGFNYYGYRYYDPSTGRWLSRDIVEEDGGLNLFGMVGNDPINAFDPFGQEAFTATATAKSYIAKLGKQDKTILTQASKPGLINNWLVNGSQNFSEWLYGLNEDPQSDGMDGKYRLFTKVKFEFCCKSGKIEFNNKEGQGYTIDKDGGSEAFWGLISGTINVDNFKATKSGDSAFTFQWRGFGRPNKLAEPTFQFIKFRKAANIWHQVSGRIYCNGDKGYIAGPTH